MKGDTPFFESVEIPDITYTVVDPVTSEALRVDDRVLQYGGVKGTLNAYVGLPLDQVIVPAGVPVSVARATGSELITRSIKQTSTVSPTEASWTVEFTYCSTTINIGGTYTRNRLFVHRGEDEELFAASLSSEGDKESFWRAGSFIRQMFLDWSLVRKKLEGI